MPKRITMIADLPSIAGSALRLLHAPLLGQADPLQGGGAPAAAAGGSSGGAAPAAGGGWLSWVMMLGVFAVFYFLVLRPQQKRAASHKSFLDGLQIGSQVVTSGGIYGKVIAIEDQIVRVEIAPKVEIRIHKSYVAGAAANAKEALEAQQK
jgi:preprotein translocase subunit YajC